MNATRQVYTELYRKRRMLTHTSDYFRHFRLLSNDEKRIARAARKSFSDFSRPQVSYTPEALKQRKDEANAAQKRAEAEELLNDARVELNSAIGKIKQAVKGTSEEHRARAYIIPHLESWVDGENEDTSIENLIEAIVYPDEDES